MVDETKDQEEDIQNTTAETSQDTDSESVEKTEPTTEDKYNELNDKYLRLYSEFDNYRKRTSRERVELFKTASKHG
jgi:molecular chaperone GrpE